MNLPILLSAILAAAQASWDPNTAQYEHVTTLDRNGRFLLSWQTTADSLIHFKAEVRTQGWFGMGLSPNGGMPGSDIYLAWVNPDTGKMVLSDRNAPTAWVPEKDGQNDLVLEAFAKNATHITAQFHRKMDTCDDDDRPIEGNTMRVLFAYGDVSPTDEASFDGRFKHQPADRGNRAIFFNELNTPNSINPNAHDPQEWHLDITAHDVPLQENRETLYWCLTRRLPENRGKQHMIRYEPLIEEASLPYVHHFILYSCAKDMSEYADKEEECFNEEQTKFSAMYECTTKYLAGWAVGGTHHIFPKGVGYPMFEADSDKFVMLEIHYDNSAHNRNIRDSSGIRLWLTPALRPVEAGTTMIGLPVGPIFQIVPPQQDNFTNYAVCTADCTADLPKDGVNVFSGLLHTHLLGRRVKLRQIRDGVELPPLFQDDNYDFNYQEPRVKSSTVKMMPGDEFILECSLSSRSRGRTTFSGYGTPEEMCLVFVEYYPRSAYQLHSCFSTYEPAEALKSLGARNATYRYDVENGAGEWKKVEDFIADDVRWAENDNVAKWQTAVRDGKHINFCSSSRKTNGTVPPVTTLAEARASAGLNLKGVLHIPQEKLAATIRDLSIKTQKSKEIQGLPKVRVPFVANPTCRGVAPGVAFGALLTLLLAHLL